jgi:trafficking protein particle complex subunit 1
MIYDFYIFNRSGTCTFSESYSQEALPKKSDIKKLIFGMIYMLRDLTGKLSPRGSDNLHVVRTNTFAIHHYQSETGLIFVLVTKANIADLSRKLEWIYKNLYVENVSRNVLFILDHKKPIDNGLFRKKVNDYILVDSNTSKLVKNDSSNGSSNHQQENQLKNKI